jgi:hypothetical protein
MMKKTYINPEMQVIKIEGRQLMAGSPGLGGQYTGGTPESRWFDDEDE